MAKVKVSGVTAKTFNGIGNVEQNLSGISLKFTEKGVTKTLVYGTDYTVSYGNNDKAGTASIIFEGKGLYSGTLKKNFKITKVNLANVILDQSKITAKMEKAGAKPDVILTYNGVTLEQGKDYTLTYSNNKSTSGNKKPTIKIKGKGSYTGNLTRYFTIVQKELADEAITVSAADVKYSADKKIYTTKVRVFDNGVELKLNKDYRVTFAQTPVNGLSAEGYAVDTVVIQGIGDYKGTRNEEFRIVAKLLSDKQIKANVKSVKYFNGQEVSLNKSEIVVTDNGVSVPASCYEIVGYKDNNKAGTAKVIIRGLGRYGGEKTISFKIKKVK